MRIILWILNGLTPEISRVFINDISVKGPRSDDRGEEVLPSIRRFITKYIYNIDQVLLYVELAKYIIKIPKSQFIRQSVIIVGYIYNTNSRSLNQAKIKKILEQEVYINISKVRAFLGIIIFYRIWIKKFTLIITPLYTLISKDITFKQEDEEKKVIDHLKARIIITPVLITIDYNKGAGLIFIRVNSNRLGQGYEIG